MNRREYRKLINQVLYEIDIKVYEGDEKYSNLSAYSSYSDMINGLCTEREYELLGSNHMTLITLALLNEDCFVDNQCGKGYAEYIRSLSDKGIDYDMLFAKSDKYIKLLKDKFNANMNDYNMIRVYESFKKCIVVD